MSIASAIDIAAISIYIYPHKKVMHVISLSSDQTIKQILNDSCFESA